MLEARGSEKSHFAILNHKRSEDRTRGQIPILSSRARGIKRLYSPVRNSHSGILYQDAARPEFKRTSPFVRRVLLRKLLGC